MKQFLFYYNSKGENLNPFKTFINFFILSSFKIFDCFETLNFTIP